METPNNKPPHSVGALALLVINLLLVVCFCYILGFVVPIFGDMFNDFGAKLPESIERLLDISNILMAWRGLGLSLLLCCAVAAIIWIYQTLHSRGDNRTLSVRLWTILLAIVVLTGIMISTLVSPIFTMGDVLGEPKATPGNPSQTIGREVAPQPER